MCFSLRVYSSGTCRLAAKTAGRHARPTRTARKGQALDGMICGQMATWTAADRITDGHDVFRLDILFFYKKVIGGFNVVAGLFGRRFSRGCPVSRVVVCQNAVAMHLELFAEGWNIGDSLVISMTEQHDGHAFLSFQPQGIQCFAVGGQLAIACWLCGRRRRKQLLFNDCA